MFFCRCPPRSPRSLAGRFGDQRNNFAARRKQYFRFLLHNVPLPKRLLSESNFSLLHNTQRVRSSTSAGLVGAIPVSIRLPRDKVNYVYCILFLRNLIWLVVNTPHCLLYLAYRGLRCGNAWRYVAAGLALRANSAFRRHFRHRPVPQNGHLV